MKKSRAGAWGLLLVASLLVSSAVFAEPLIVLEGDTPKPGVVVEWSGDGRKVELTLKDGADANAVAAAIEANVERTRTKVRAGKVLVIGKTEAELLPALAEVDLGGEGDLDLLASTALGEDVDSGSSLRAKKTAELDKLLADRATVAEGKVTAVKTGDFPKTAVAVRILRGPTGALGKKIRKGKTVVFLPVLAKKGDRIDLSDDKTQTNLGAWYLESGDRVKVKVGKPSGEGFEAELISR